MENTVQETKCINCGRTLDNAPELENGGKPINCRNAYEQICKLLRQGRTHKRNVTYWQSRLNMCRKGRALEYCSE